MKIGDFPYLISNSSFNTTLSLYDFTTSKETSILHGHIKGVWIPLCITHFNLRVAITTPSFTGLSIFFVKFTTSPHTTNAIYDVEFSSDGRCFVSCSSNTICIWEMLNCMNFTNNNRQVITGYIDGVVKL